MASRAISIDNFAEALRAGTIPARRAARDGAEVFEFPAVESTNSRGARLVWHLWVSARDGRGAPVPIDDAWLAPGARTPAGVAGVIMTESYQVSADGARGKTRDNVVPTVVASGKNLAKVNATNPVTQALRDALGRYNAHAKKADAAADTAKPAATAATPARAAEPPASDKPPPMLVKKHGETREATLGPEDFERGVTVQRKYNGVRVVMYLAGPPGAEETWMYSRTKGDYPGFAAIRDEALACFLLDPPAVPDELIQPPRRCGAAPLAPAELARARAAYAEDRVHLDGEIYLHGQTLRWISGQARREDDEGELNYMCFDCFFPAAKAAGFEMASAHRQRYVDLLFAEAARRRASSPEASGATAHIRRVENFAAESLAAVEALRDQFLAEKYEGAIARKDCEGYRYSYNNYHSANLVKFKPIEDDEFEVVGFTEGSKGKDVGAVIWVCEVDAAHAADPADKLFNVVPKDMTYEERYAVFRCLGAEVDNTPENIAAGGPPRLTRFERDFRGRPLTVEFPERSTKTGKPVQAKALTFRTYEDNVAQDPLKRLYAECVRPG